MVVVVVVVVDVVGAVVVDSSYFDFIQTFQPKIPSR